MESMKNRYPDHTQTALRWSAILRRSEPPVLSERMSSRMAELAAHLPEDEFIGWQMFVPTEGLIRFESFGSASVQVSDLEWVAEKSAKTASPEPDDGKRPEPAGGILYELRIPAEQSARCRAIGFSASSAAGNAAAGETPGSVWPTFFSRQFGELVRTLRLEGAQLRYCAGRASPEEQTRCEQAVLAGWNSTLQPEEYIGVPVRAKALLVLPGQPSIRLLSVLDEHIRGILLQPLGPLTESRCRRIWQRPLSTAQVLPNIAARILALEPAAGAVPVLGVESCSPSVPPIPAGHPDPSDPRPLRIGQAQGNSGLPRSIFLGDADLRRHWQIIGQTGTGKSTLLAGTILSAIQNGRGLTFFDPHGSTIDALLPCIPRSCARRVRVVRLGDADNPVPLNLWPSDDPGECEKTVSDLNLLFGEIFDPQQQGFVGPRWERWFSVFALAAITLLGKRANFESIVTLSQNRENMHKLYDIILPGNPRIAQAIRCEFGENDSREFGDFISWCVCKFQRLTSVPQLRGTLGAGANALDFGRSIDTDAVTLIDLGSPVMGVHAARVLGTLLLLQLWNAATSRKNRERTHLVVMDEAHLFQTNPLPQMLAEGRKFGLALVLAHQHCGQLSREVREALDANSANFSAFRLSVRDSVDAARRLGDPRFQEELCRLSAFSAITTLSVDGCQTEPFTLQIQRAEPLSSGAVIASEIQRRSLQTLVEPYRSCRALTSDEIQNILDRHAEDRRAEDRPRKAPAPRKLPAAIRQLQKVVEEETLDAAV